MVNYNVANILKENVASASGSRNSGAKGRGEVPSSKFRVQGSGFADSSLPRPSRPVGRVCSADTVQLSVAAMRPSAFLLTSLLPTSINKKQQAMLLPVISPG